MAHAVLKGAVLFVCVKHNQLPEVWESHSTSSNTHVDMTLMDDATHDHHELSTQSD